MNPISAGIIYVMHAPYFWGSMGFTTASALFIGAYIYGGDVTNLKKGIIMVLSYGLMICWTNIMRVTNALAGINMPPSVLPMAYASTISLISITIFWLIGIALGVIWFKFKGWRK